MDGQFRLSFFPFQVSILNSQNQQLMQETALDILQTIVKHSHKPLSTLLVDIAFPATVKCILSTDDHAIMQSGGECLRAFINGKSINCFPLSLAFFAIQSTEI